MNAKTKILVAALVGLVVGFGSTFTIFLTSWTALIAWGAVGLVIGAFARTRAETFWSGTAYGAALTTSFLLGGFHGTSDKIEPFLGLVLIVGIVGSACGRGLAFIGYLLWAWWNNKGVETHHPGTLT